MVPFIGWVSFGAPVVQISISTAFAFLVGLGKAGHDRGNWQDPRRILDFAKERAREVWAETIWFACGHVASLNTQVCYGRANSGEGGEDGNESRSAKGGD